MGSGVGGGGGGSLGAKGSVTRGVRENTPQILII